MTDMTPRLGFPLLSSGQAQKDVTHNEALVLADGLIQPVVQAVAPAAIPARPLPGQCWIVGNGAGGVWQGHDNAFACWTEGGWRFIATQEGMGAWSLADGVPARRADNGWIVGRVDVSAVRIAGKQVLGLQQPAVANPTGGSTIDAEVRVAVSAILAALRTHGLIAG